MGVCTVLTGQSCPPSDLSTFGASDTNFWHGVLSEVLTFPGVAAYAIDPQILAIQTMFLAAKL